MSHHASGPNFDFPRGGNRFMLDVVAPRRRFLIAKVGGAAAITLPMVAVATKSDRKFQNLNQTKGK